MVRRVVQVVGSVVFWTYPRGTWQYDILCILILAFIFLTPRTLFDGSPSSETQKPEKIQEEELLKKRGTEQATLASP